MVQALLKVLWLFLSKESPHYTKLWLGFPEIIKFQRFKVYHSKAGVYIYISSLIWLADINNYLCWWTISCCCAFPCETLASDNTIHWPIQISGKILHTYLYSATMCTMAEVWYNYYCQQSLCNALARVSKNLTGIENMDDGKMSWQRCSLMFCHYPHNILFVFIITVWTFCFHHHNTYCFTIRQVLLFLSYFLIISLSCHFQ